MATKLFVWTDDLLTGIPLIDAQHQEYFRRVNRALAAAQSAERQEELLVALDFAQTYAMEHFDAEQNLMSFHEYPRYDQHVQQHAFFAERLDTITEALSGGAAADDESRRLNGLLVDWFVRHIRTEDQSLARYVMQKAQ